MMMKMVICMMMRMILIKKIWKYKILRKFQKKILMMIIIYSSLKIKKIVMN